MAKREHNSASRAPGAPAVSVVMPVHNALPYLDAAVESILSQTFEDFEFVILNDCSTDGSLERLHYWAARDPRIVLIDSPRQLGPVGSSNMVARAARAELVARMDADDLSAPDRLRVQHDLLSRRPEVGIVASLCDVIDASGRKRRSAEAWRLSRPSVFVPFAHGAMMYRRAIFEKVGGYRAECEYWEDQDLITRMAGLTKVAVLPAAFYTVRQSGTSTRVAAQQERIEAAVDRMYRSMRRLEQGSTYDDLLTDEPPRKIDPRVFLALGSVVLWAGRRPRLFSRFLRRARLGFDFKTFALALWTAWASVSPETLRKFQLSVLNIRNWAWAGEIRTNDPVLWTPPRRKANVG